MNDFLFISEQRSRNPVSKLSLIVAALTQPPKHMELHVTAGFMTLYHNINIYDFRRNMKLY